MCKGKIKTEVDKKGYFLRLSLGLGYSVALAGVKLAEENMARVSCLHSSVRPFVPNDIRKVGWRKELFLSIIAVPLCTSKKAKMGWTKSMPISAVLFPTELFLPNQPCCLRRSGRSFFSTPTNPGWLQTQYHEGLPPPPPWTPPHSRGGELSQQQLLPLLAWDGGRGGGGGGGDNSPTARGEEEDHQSCHHSSADDHQYR